MVPVVVQIRKGLRDHMLIVEIRMLKDAETKNILHFQNKKACLCNSCFCASSDGILQIWFIVMGLCHEFMQITVCVQPPVFCIYVELLMVYCDVIIYTE